MGTTTVPKLRSTSTTTPKNNACNNSFSKTLSTSTHSSETAQTTFKNIPKTITEISQTVVYNNETTSSGTPNTLTDVPRRIRSYSSIKNAGNIVSKHVTETSEKQHDKHEVPDKRVHNDNWNNIDKSVTIYVLKNPTVESQVTVDNIAEFPGKPKNEQQQTPVNQSAFLQPSSIKSTTSALVPKEVRYEVKGNIKNQRKRHIGSPRKSRKVWSNFNPPRQFYYGFKPIANPRYLPATTGRYYKRY